jgi:intein/homing endonuclease
MFSDTMNRNSPEVYRDKGAKIYNSNLCVAPWTEVDIRVNGTEMTVPIIALDAFFQLGGYKTLEVKSFNIDSGVIEYKEVLDSAQTSSKAKVIRITDEVSGKSITCTPEHKVYTTNRGYVMAKDLKEDDNLLIK